MNAKFLEKNPSTEELNNLERSLDFIENTQEIIDLYYQDASEYPQLSQEEIISLSKLKDEGNIEAQEKLINSFLFLVVYWVNKYKTLPLSGGIDEMDLIQEGNIGLMVAIKKYDYKKGAKLSTYASWWIKQHITRALDNQNSLIRMPFWFCEKQKKIQQISNEFYKANKRLPSIDEISELTNFTRNEILDLQKHSPVIIYLSTPVNANTTDSDEKFDLNSIIGDKNEDTSKKVETKILKETLLPTIESFLTPREFDIIKEHFGFNENHKPKTLEEIAQKYGLSRERIRSIEKKALRKLKNDPNFKNMYEDFT